MSYGHFMAEMDVGFGQRDLINSQSCRILSTQSGVMRTNCMDCLDRTMCRRTVCHSTNVVQSLDYRNWPNLSSQGRLLTSNSTNLAYRVSLAASLSKSSLTKSSSRHSEMHGPTMLISYRSSTLAPQLLRLISQEQASDRLLELCLTASTQ